MTTPVVVPEKYVGVEKPFLLSKGNLEGASTVAVGEVLVPSGTEAGSFVGLVPFQKGTVFTVHDKCVHVETVAATATLDLGVIYDGDEDDVPTAFVSAASAAADGFLAVDEDAGLTLVTEADGWLALRINVAAAAADALVKFAVPLTRGYRAE